MTFIFDTGSSWLWVPSDTCPKSQCPGTTFHFGSSSSYTPTTVSEKITYGKGQVQGYIVSDSVSLTDSIALMARNSKFLSIYTASDISSVRSDGLLGLSPQFMSNGDGELLISSLRRNGVIPRQMFTMQFKSTS